MQTSSLARRPCTLFELTTHVLVSFLFHVTRKKQEGQHDHYFPLQDFVNLQPDTEMKCNFRFE